MQTGAVLVGTFAAAARAFTGPTPPPEDSGPLMPPNRRRLPAVRIDHGRLSSPSPRAVDIGVALTLAAWAVPEVPWWWRAPGHQASNTMWALAGVAVVESLPFLWRRSRPAMVFLLAAAAAGVKLTMLPRGTSALAAALLAAYGLGAYGDHRARRAARYLGRASMLMSLLLAAGVFGAHLRSWGLQSALLAAALLIGEAGRLRQDAAAAAVRAAELGERNRIARELHDILAHLLSGIALTAGAARRAEQNGHGPRPGTGTGTSQRIGALSVIEASARDALSELGNLLGVLRKDSDQRPALKPAPAISDIPELLDEIRSGGAGAELTVAGEVWRLPDGISLAAYRIVQEALTNVRRHAPGAHVHVRLTYNAQQLRVEVANHASSLPRAAAAAAGRAPGNGLRGMRERVQLYGGDLQAGPTPSGGYLVTATLRATRADRAR